MKVVAISGFSVISQDGAASQSLYIDTLGLPMTRDGDYAFVDGFPGAHHFGVWPLKNAAEACFGTPEWPDDIAIPTASVEFELESPEAVAEAVTEMEARGQIFIHPARTEPWGQTVARFISPEGVLTGLSYAPWLHQN
ncbi:glyoxalase/bleomycin resistance protein/dioxygenase [Ketogulonicigenium robustum]|uniref:Glyoxalase/bleomycin resistance protein/dioxygenase n=1 Tax=Ketogulonicigenium robustum TaxID=92947 RepID=A0A1W6NYF0_9RHOB|nr:VOC family protein [Ketogulonicigenium robustum]ARO14201.1 glyoxalase/bleomycin resistance protein/dioxygenase [Ketogulonicigenium robustum]